jgi:hypothetical protein
MVRFREYVDHLKATRGPVTPVSCPPPDPGEKSTGPGKKSKSRTVDQPLRRQVSILCISISSEIPDKILILDFFHPNITEKY